MTDITNRWIVTFVTSRGQFRIWNNYKDKAIELARELKKIGVNGVEVWDAKLEKIVWIWGETPNPN